MISQSTQHATRLLRIHEDVVIAAQAAIQLPIENAGIVAVAILNIAIDL
jgi:hypothetical protein